MPRIRSLKPEHRQHRKVGQLSHFEYRLWVGLLLEVDDYGRMICDALQIRASIFPYYRQLKVASVEQGIQRLAVLELIRLYRAGEQIYLDFPSWADHQRIDHPTPSKLPPYHPENDISRTFTKPREASRVSAGARADLIGSEGKDLIGGEGTLAKSHELARWTTGLTPAQCREMREKTGQEFISSTILEAVEKSPRLRSDARLRSAPWWQSILRAYPAVFDVCAEIAKAESWLQTKGRNHRDLAAFMRNWLSKEQRDAVIQERADG